MSIRAWRIVQTRHATQAFDGEGARRFGGRWNLKGTRMVYTAESLSLASLEILVNIDSAVTLGRYVSIPIDFDEQLCKALAGRDLSGDWAGNPAPSSTQKIGTAWTSTRETVVLAVPSAVVHRERNFLLNPEHPDFSSVRIGKPSVCPPRLW